MASTTHLHIDVVAFQDSKWPTKLTNKPHLVMDVRQYIGRGKFNAGKNALHNPELCERLREMKGAKDCLADLVRKIDELVLAHKDVYVVVGCAKGKHRSVVIGLALKEHYDTIRTDLVCHYAK